MPSDWNIFINGKVDPNNPLPFLDPPLGNPTIRIFDPDVPEELARIDYGPEYDDNKDPYWDEDYVGVQEMPANERLHFEDSPSVDTRFFEPGEFMNFKTELVGVKADGTVVPLGSGFTWKSNTTNVSDIINLSTLNDGTLPAVASGGVFDVQPYFVPEPNSLSILALVMSSLLISGRRKIGSKSQDCII